MIVGSNGHRNMMLQRPRSVLQRGTTEREDDRVWLRVVAHYAASATEIRAVAHHSNTTNCYKLFASSTALSMTSFRVHSNDFKLKFGVNIKLVQIC